MIYQYLCEECKKHFDVIKSVKEYNREEKCKCGKTGRKIFSISKPIINKTNAEYYPSLGTVVKSKNHRSELMKKHNLIEVGNEKPETVHREMEKTIKQKTSWDDL